MIPAGLGAALVALSTLTTLLYIGLGFLPRPSPAAAIWSLAFCGSMVSSYLWAAADVSDSAVLRATASGFMVAMVGVVWIGLCARRGATGWRWWPVIAFAIGAPLLLAALAETSVFLTAVRAVFLAAGVFSALTIAELVRLGPLLRDEILPLALMSALFVLFAALGLAHEVVRLTTGQDAGQVLSTTRNLNILGSLLFLVTAVVTLLLLTRRDTPAPGTLEDSSFQTVARDRLARAQAVRDRWWSVLVVRLDDPESLRDASSTNAFEHMAEQFTASVRQALPAESDIEQRGATELVVVLPRPVGAVRQILANLLEQVAESGADGPLAVRLSASVGWAQVEVAGYDLDTLVRVAGDAAAEAEAAGGDQWNRATAATV
ncbi:hypothetical protein [Microbacterium aurum]